ncbi:uncharacterized protein [Diadema setosum]|uniref:uncharacterized protein n=1 Tax=Diadema setosum TaxID=31175 RepID=UPI003B3A4314
MEAKQHEQRASAKLPLETKDSGISCYTPSPPPKKSSVLQQHSYQPKPKELRRRVPSRESPVREPSLQRDSPIEHRGIFPPRLDLSSIVGDGSDDECRSAGTMSSERTSGSDDRPHPELAVAVETPSTRSCSRLSNPVSTPEGYQTDAECSSSSSVLSGSSSPKPGGLRGLRSCGSDGLEDESEGNILKVKLKLKSSQPDESDHSSRNRESKSCEAVASISKAMSKDLHTSQQAQREVLARSSIAKYMPLPGIGQEKDTHPPSDHGERELPQGSRNLPISVERENSEIREQRIKVLERSSSQTEMRTAPRPVPPPQSAKSVSRRAIRMQQFARRKSASHAEASSRSSVISSSEPEDPSSNVLLAVRLPNGARVQNLFRNSEQLRSIVQFALREGKCSVSIDDVFLVTNDMPKKELTDLKQTIEGAKLRDRTLLHLQELN